MSITRRAIRRLLLDQIPLLGFYSTADSVGATSIVDTFAFQDSNLTVQHFKGTYIYRPDRTNDDRIKKAGNLTLASGTLATTGSNYVDQSDLNYEIIGVLHPDELNACIQRAQRRTYHETQVPLSPDLTDNDMSAATTTSWSQINADETLSKITTAAKVFSGLRSLRVQNATANGGAQSVTVRIPTLTYVSISAIVHADVGTANLILWDVTNSVALATVSTSEEGWVHLHWNGQVGSTTEQVALRLTGTESNADLYWDNVTLLRTDDMRLLAPSWLDEPFKFLKLRQAAYKKSLSANSDDANSRYFRDWYQPREFSLDPFHPEANPYAIQLARPLPIADMWIEAKRPFSDLEPLTNDTDTTTAPQDLVIAYSKLELANLLIKRFPNEAMWLGLKAESELEVASETLARPEIPQAPIKRQVRTRV